MNAGEVRSTHISITMSDWIELSKGLSRALRLMEDQGSVFAGIVVGGSSQVSTEYGSDQTVGLCQSHRQFTIPCRQRLGVRARHFRQWGLPRNLPQYDPQRCGHRIR